MKEFRKKAEEIRQDIKRDPVKEGQVEIHYENKMDFAQFSPRRNFSIPNLISLFRILLIPFILYAYFNEQIVQAIVLIVLSGISDGVDGFVARHFGQITTLGKVLDPIADKLTQVALAICLCISYPEMVPLLITLVVKESLMLYGGLRLLKAGVQPFSARIWGKVATVLFYIGVTAIIVFSKSMSSPVLHGIVALIIAVMLFSMVCYGREFHRHLVEARQNAR